MISYTIKFFFKSPYSPQLIQKLLLSAKNQGYIFSDSFTHEILTIDQAHHKLQEFDIENIPVIRMKIEDTYINLFSITYPDSSWALSFGNQTNIWQTYQGHLINGKMIDNARYLRALLKLIPEFILENIYLDSDMMLLRNEEIPTNALFAVTQMPKEFTLQDFVTIFNLAHKNGVNFIEDNNQNGSDILFTIKKIFQEFQNNGCCTYTIAYKTTTASMYFSHNRIALRIMPPIKTPTTTFFIENIECLLAFCENFGIYEIKTNF